MDVATPSVAEWILLLALGSIAGAISALRGLKNASPADRLIVGAAEGATTLFVAVTTFLLAHAFLPLFGVQVSTVGLIAASALAAHFGLRETIAAVIKLRITLLKE